MRQTHVSLADVLLEVHQARLFMHLFACIYKFAAIVILSHGGRRSDGERIMGRGGACEHALWLLDAGLIEWIWNLNFLCAHAIAVV
jgi:hypothetical protein